MIGLEQLLDEVIQKWQTDGIDIRPGTSDDEIRAFEQRFKVELPLDVMAYLRRIDGMPDNAMDAELFRLWPLREVDAASSVLSLDATVFEGQFVFADHSIQAYHFSVAMGRASPGAVARVADRPVQVASSFKQFLDRYLHDPDALFRSESV